ncbi:MAG: hypothetical protein EHM61_21205 [Acidobacteria bacterium]|nr:MAG: hypothetical protein EHM61_21205 [Acidobacteriota bacterium]
MRLRDSFVIITLCLSLCVLVFGQVFPSSLQTPDVVYGASWVEWPGSVPDRGLVLAVSGPEGLYLKQEYPAGSWARFSLVDEQGRPRQEGVYKWELVLHADGWQDPNELGQRGGQIRAGWFQIQDGRVVAEQNRGESQPVVVEESAPENSLYVDEQGRVGVGTSMPRAQLHMKGTDPGLTIEDAQTGGREYTLRSQKSGDGSLGLFDETTGKIRWLVDAEGRMGISTTKPTSTLTVDGYIEATKGFLVNGRPFPSSGGFLGAVPLSTEGASNSYFGTGAGATTTGTQDSFFGANAGSVNTTGSMNAFFGAWTGNANTTGEGNAFFGRTAGYRNTTGGYNTFSGLAAGAGNTTGGHNSSLGHSAGLGVTVENNNTFVGAGADLNPGADPLTNPVNNATAIGFQAYVSRSNSLVLGGVRGFQGVTVETFVGIGTPSPDRQFVVEGSEALGKFRRYNATTASHGPAFLFERARGMNTAPLNMAPGDYLGKVQFRGLASGNWIEYGALAFIASDTNQNGRFSFVDRDLVTERMVVLNTGNVGIGTNAPTERLDVAGNLRIRGSVVYGAPAGIPDYVFESDYRLMPMAELRRYVRSEKHLPNVPQASEIQKNGVNLGEFQMKLLEKVEELTLYTLEQAKVIEHQNEEATVLKDRVEALEQMVKLLLARSSD